MTKDKVIQITKMFMGVALIAIIAYDVWAMDKGGTEGSISHTIIAMSYKYPIMTFASGVLCGHLFWRVRDTKELVKISENTRK